MESCLNGCKYCYANKTPRKAVENYRFHDPNSPLLLGNLRETDVVHQGAQKSFLADRDKNKGVSSSRKDGTK